MLKKVVLSPSIDGSPSLHLDQMERIPAKTPPGSELRLGNQDLIRFADYAQKHGFKVTSFMISDTYLSPLEEDDQEEISDRLLEMLQSYGGEEVEAAMQDEYRGLYVVGVELLQNSSGMHVSVRRRGYVDTSIFKEAEKLLRSAWRELNLF